MAVTISTVHALANIAKMSEDTPENPVMIQAWPNHDKTQHEDRGTRNIAARVVLSALATVEIVESLYSVQPASTSLVIVL